MTPALRCAREGEARILTVASFGGTLEDSPDPGSTPSSEGSYMAKALIGYMNSDPRTPARLAAENARLRARVSELEALTLKLARENDALEAAATGEVLAVETDLQPA